MGKGLQLGCRDAWHITGQTVHATLGSAGNLDELIALLTDDLVQQIGWRQWCWTREVIPQFANDLPAVGDDDWAVLSGDATRVLALYLDDSGRFGVVVVER